MNKAFFRSLEERSEMWTATATILSGARIALPARNSAGSVTPGRGSCAISNRPAYSKARASSNMSGIGSNPLISRKSLLEFAFGSQAVTSNPASRAAFVNSPKPAPTSMSRGPRANRRQWLTIRDASMAASG
jgi:hypothetical protein